MTNYEFPDWLLEQGGALRALPLQWTSQRTAALRPERGDFSLVANSVAAFVVAHFAWRPSDDETEQPMRRRRRDVQQLADIPDDGRDPAPRRVSPGRHQRPEPPVDFEEPLPHRAHSCGNVGGSGRIHEAHSDPTMKHVR